MPGKALRSQFSEKGIKTIMYRYSDDIYIYGLIISDFSEQNLDFAKTNPEDYYNAMKETSLAKSGIIVKSEKTIPYQRMLGKEIVYTIIGKRNIEYTYYRRFFFIGSKIYQISFGGPSRKKTKLMNDMNKFFYSFKFNNKQNIKLKQKDSIN
jgi:hypothetical protein